MCAATVHLGLWCHACRCSSLCMDVWIALIAHHLSLRSPEEGTGSPREGWSCRWLLTIMQELEIKTELYGRAPSDANHRAISSAPPLYFIFFKLSIPIGKPSSMKPEQKSFCACE